MKRLEAKLKEYQESDRNWMSKEFKDLAERLHEGIYRFDIEARQFIFFNKTAIEIFGSPNASMMISRPRVSCCGFTRKTWMLCGERRGNRACLDATAVRSNTAMPDLDGTYRWTVRPLGSDARFRGAAEVFRRYRH